MDDIDYVKPNVVPLSSLTRWGPPPGSASSNDSTRADPLQPSADPLPESSASSCSIRFPFSAEINHKIVLWKGSLVRLEVDAIVNSSNEPLTERHGLSGLIIREGGLELEADISRLEGCRTGEAKLSKAGNLPCRHVLHTVGPRFNLKYKTAAENALHNCYRACLQLVREHGLRSVAFPVVNSERRGYPPENGAHIALRTVRRCLEHFGHAIDAVVFCMDRDEDVLVYSRLLPLYFPRSADEAARVRALLPTDCGNEWGETCLPERQIRIAAFPHDAIGAASASDGDGDDDDDDDGAVGAAAQPAERAAVRLLGGLAADVDHRHAPIPPAAALHQRLAARARAGDATELVRRNFVFLSGVDRGRTVVLVLADAMPSLELEGDRVLVCITRVLLQTLDRPYCVVYVCSNASAEQTPSFSYLRQLYTLWDSCWADQLQGFFVVEPGFLLRVTLALARPFLSDRFAAQLVVVDELGELPRYVSAAALHLPERFRLQTQQQQQTPTTAGAL